MKDQETHAFDPRNVRDREDHCEFEASMGYIVRPCLKKKTKKPANHISLYFLNAGIKGMCHLA